MSIREDLERWEKAYLSPYATLSMESKGRLRDEPQCDIRPVFQRDRDRVVHSKSFRRLKDKTQVFLAPEGDHYRTRLTHTLEVSQNARTIAKALRMNEDLTEAIALGHDIGHTPFGHAGERALRRVCPEGFEHNIQSVRVVEVLEKRGNGLNLTKEVRDGILNHKTKGNPSTLEGKIVRFSDKIAYISHDVDDAIHARRLTGERTLIGFAVCSFTIDSEGMFRDVTLVRSSGSQRLDASALNAVRAASGVIKRPPIIGPDPIRVSLQVKYQYAL